MKSGIVLRGLSHRICQLALLALVMAAPLASRAAATIWSGPVTLFSRADGANPALAANQDRLTPNVWLTRAGSLGLYNARTESAFTHFFSPADTAWANGTTANYSALSYTDWNTWANGVNPGPPSTVGVNAVLHLITDDIYLDIQFTSWSGSSGGGFAYLRSTPSLVPEPAAGLLLLGGLAAVAGVRGVKRRNVEVAVPRKAYYSIALRRGSGGTRPLAAAPGAVCSSHTARWSRLGLRPIRRLQHQVHQPVCLGGVDRPARRAQSSGFSSSLSVQGSARARAEPEDGLDS